MPIKSSIEAGAAAVLAEVMRGLSLEPGQGREGASLSPGEVRAAAEGLLTLPERPFAALTQLRARPEIVNSLTGEWANPLLIHLFNVQPPIWELITRLRRAYATVQQPEDAELRAALVTSVATAVTPREAAPELADRWKREAADRAAGAGDGADRAVAQQREAFLQRYWKLRPSHLKTQADVARAAGVHVNTIVGIERGRARPHYGTIVKLAKAFGVAPEELAPIP